MTQGLLQSGERQSHPSMLAVDVLDKMGKELIRLCDKMEPHGLVDYQMGIWEEEILSGKLEITHWIRNISPNFA